jgi:preprotein translocase subunit SecG
MHIWMNLLVVLQMVAAIVMIGLVLVQHGKGADMGASFGSGASGSLFGATGSASFLSRTTAVCATVFFLATLGLAFMSNSVSRAQPADTGSVLEKAAPAVPQIPTAAQVPASGASN